MGVLGIYNPLVDTSAPNQFDNSLGYSVQETNHYGTVSGKSPIFEIFTLFDLTILSFIDISKATSTTYGWFANLENLYSYVNPAKVLVAAALYSGSGSASALACSSFLNTYCPATRNCAVLRCSSWDSSAAETTLMPHYTDGIVAPYVSPFTYMIKRKGAGPYSFYVTDKLNFIGTRNGETSYSPHSDLIAIDLPMVAATGEKDSAGSTVTNVLDPAQMVEYLKARIDDALADTPTVSVVPDTKWTRDTDDGIATPITHIANGSSLIFKFSEKAVGPADPAKYAITGSPSTPAGLVKTPNGLSPNTNSPTPDGLLASNYILTTPVDNSYDRWQLNLSGFDASAAHADDGKILTIDPTAILDGSGNAFSLDAANTSPLKFLVDVAGAAAETPTWEVIVTENPGTASEKANVIAKSDGTPATIASIGSTNWKVSVRLLTKFPGVSIPSGRLVSPLAALAFGGPSKMKSTDIIGPTSNGTYTIHLDAYTNGAGKAIAACDYIFANGAGAGAGNLLISSPSANSSVNTMAASYTLSAAIQSGTITWTRTSGSADLQSPHVHTLTGSELTAGSHNGVAVTGLVNGTVYSVVFSGLDASANAVLATIANVTFDTTAPTIVSATWSIA